jgi:hypothetical protein
MKTAKFYRVVLYLSVAYLASWTFTVQYAPAALERYIVKREGSGVSNLPPVAVEVDVTLYPVPFLAKAGWVTTQGSIIYRTRSAWFVWTPPASYQITEATGLNRK